MSSTYLVEIKDAIVNNSLEQFTSDELIEALKLTDELYFNGDESGNESPLTDLEYDALRRYTLVIDRTNPYFIGVGSTVRGGKIKLPYQMGSLDQIYEGEIVDWVKKNNLLNEDAIITDKLDGMSALVVYGSDGRFTEGYSRGDGIEGQILTSHINNIRCIPKIISSNIKSVRGELIISKENWKKVQQITRTTSGKMYKNSRNCITGLMNARKLHKKELYDLIDFVAYEVKEYYEKNPRRFY